jgi:hypothetical protein
LARPLGLYLASRVAVMVAVATVVMLKLGLINHGFQSELWPLIPPGRPILRALGTWDASWYLHIAAHGYPNAAGKSVAFLPLFPFVIRAVAVVTGLNVLYAGILANFIIGAAGAVGVWMLMRRLTDVRTADRATALWSFFPGAMTLTLVYSEGLLVVLAVVCLMALLRRRWLVAGIAAALAGATSPEGLALTACCAWAAGAVILHRPKEPGTSTPAGGPVGKVDGERWRALIAPALAPLGWLAYQGYLWARSGDITDWWHVEKLWFRGGFDPWQATGDKVRLALSHPGVPDDLVPALGALVLVVAAILLWRWKPPAIVTIYAAVVMVLVLSSAVVGARPRFFIVAFPFIAAMARPVRGPAFQALLGLSALCLGLLTLILVGGVNHDLQFTP